MAVFNTQTLRQYLTHRHYGSIQHTDTKEVLNTKTLWKYSTHGHHGSIPHPDTMKVFNTMTVSNQVCMNTSNRLGIK